jgi:hypothetical protein
LIRRGNSKEEDWEEYDDEYEYEDEEEEDIEEESSESIAPAEVEPKLTEPQVSVEIAPIIEDALRQELAVKATQIGVMQAAPGTNQGETGWYVDASTELQQWNVGYDGSWSRLQ